MACGQFEGLRFKSSRFKGLRVVAEFAAEGVHGIAGTEVAVRYNSVVSDVKAKFGDSKDLDTGPLLAGEEEHTDKLGVGEACGTDDVAVSEVRHRAVANSKDSVFIMVFIDENIFNQFHTYTVQKFKVQEFKGKALRPLRSGRAGERV